MWCVALSLIPSTEIEIAGNSNNPRGGLLRRGGIIGRFRLSFTAGLIYGNRQIPSLFVPVAMDASNQLIKTTIQHTGEHGVATECGNCVDIVCIQSTKAQSD